MIEICSDWISSFAGCMVYDSLPLVQCQTDKISPKTRMDLNLNRQMNLSLTWIILDYGPGQLMTAAKIIISLLAASIVFYLR